jgi:hypothetical protein
LSFLVITVFGINQSEHGPSIFMQAMLPPQFGSCDPWLAQLLFPQLKISVTSTEPAGSELPAASCAFVQSVNSSKFFSNSFFILFFLPPESDRRRSVDSRVPNDIATTSHLRIRQCNRVFELVAAESDEATQSDDPM